MMHPPPCTRPKALDSLRRPTHCPTLSPRNGYTCHGSLFCLITAPPCSQALDLRRCARGATTGGRGAARRLPPRCERRAVRVPPLPRRLRRAMQAGGAVDLGAAPRRRQGPGGVDRDGRRIGRPLLLLLRHPGAPAIRRRPPPMHAEHAVYTMAALSQAREFEMPSLKQQVTLGLPLGLTANAQADA